MEERATVVEQELVLRALHFTLKQGHEVPAVNHPADTHKGRQEREVDQPVVGGTVPALHDIFWAQRTVC